MSEKDDLDRLSIEEQLLKKSWNDVLNQIREDLAYIWLEDVRKDFNELKEESSRIALILNKLAKKNKESSQKVKDIRILLRHLNRIQSKESWVKKIHGDVLRVIRDVEAEKAAISRREFLKIAGKGALAAASLPIAAKIAKPAKLFAAQLPESKGYKITLPELIDAYNNVEVKAKDAALTILIGLHLKYRGINMVKQLAGTTIKEAIERLKEETFVPLEKLWYINYDGKDITLRFTEDIKTSVPVGINMGFLKIYPIKMILFKETEWQLGMDEDNILSVRLTGGKAMVVIEGVAASIAKSLGAVDMDVENAAIAFYDTENGQKSIYGITYSEKVSHGRGFDCLPISAKENAYNIWARLQKYPEYQQYKTKKGQILDIRRPGSKFITKNAILTKEGNELDERLRSELEEMAYAMRKKLNPDFGIIESHSYFVTYSIFNGVDLCTLDKDTINYGPGFEKVANKLNSHEIEEGLRRIFSENMERLILTSSNEWALFYPLVVPFSSPGALGMISTDFQNKILEKLEAEGFIDKFVLKSPDFENVYHFLR